jgi:mono/diheme cytochrome c family protein
MAADALASLAVRRTALALAALVLALGFAAVGCGGEEEASPTPDTVTGTTETTTTDTTETDTTETDTTENDTTETETTEPGGEGDAEAGKEVFLGLSGCGTCHTLSDAGTSGTVGPNLDDSQPSFDLVVDRVTNGQGGMPSFSSSLSEDEIQDVAAYVSSVAGS